MNRLAQLRQQHHLNQEELAYQLGVKQNTISNWEKGNRNIATKYLEQLANYFHVSIDYLLGNSERRQPDVTPIIPLGHSFPIPIIGTVGAGFGCLAQQEVLGYEVSELPLRDASGDNQRPPAGAKDYFFLRVTGHSMEPEIKPGDLALVHKQADVESGQLAVVLVGQELGTIKKVIKKEHTLVLQAFNPAYAPRIFAAEELEDVQIIGRVIEVKRKF